MKKLRMFSLLIFGLLAWRLFHFVDNKAVNIFYYDQWDVYAGFFTRASPRELFLWQQGPHRMGVGIWLTKLLYGFSHWNTRVESFAAAVLLVVALGLALSLRRKLRPDGGAWDALLVGKFLCLASWESLVCTPVLAIGIVPVVLVLLGARILMLESGAFRLTGLALLQFALVFTGYGIIAAAFVVYLIFREFWRETKPYPFFALVLSLAPIVIYLLTQNFDYGEANCLDKTIGVLDGVRYLGAFSSYLFGLQMYLPGFEYLGFFFFLGLALLLWKSRRNPVLFFLVGFTLCFAVASLKGRLCMGFRMAYASRYYTLMLPAIAGVHLYLLGRRRYKNLALSLVALGLFAHEGYLFFHQLPKVAIGQSLRKEWVSCYLKESSAAICDKKLNYQVHPNPPDTKLDEKMRYLKARGLGVFYSP